MYDEIRERKGEGERNKGGGGREGEEERREGRTKEGREWRRSEGLSSHCKLCGKRLTLAHVLNHCQVAFDLRRYNARHDAVLEVIDQFVRENCPPDVEAIIDLPGSVYIFPARIVPTDL